MGSHAMLLPTYNCSVLQSRFRYLGFCVAPAPQGAGSKVSMVPALCAHQTWHAGKHGFFHQNGFFCWTKQSRAKFWQIFCWEKLLLIYWCCQLNRIESWIIHCGSLGRDQEAKKPHIDSCYGETVASDGVFLGCKILGCPLFLIFGKYDVIRIH